MHPRDPSAERLAAEATASRQADQKRWQLKSSLEVAELPQGPLDDEFGSILTRVDKGSGTDRQEAISRLVSLALSGQDEVADKLIAHGAAPLVAFLLMQQSTPAHRRDAARACCGLMRYGNALSREALLAAGILPALLKLCRSRNFSPSDTAAEAMAALAETVDRGNAPRESQVISACSEFLGLQDRGCEAERLDIAKNSIHNLLKLDLLDRNDDRSAGNQPHLSMVEHVSTASIEQILRTTGWMNFIEVASHGSHAVKLAAIRIIAAVAGTDIGAEELSAHHVDSEGLETAAKDCAIVTLLKVANSGPHIAPRVKCSCLRAICRILNRPDLGASAMRKQILECAGARKIIGKR